MKSCNTSIARAMGYLSSPSQEEKQYSNVTVLGPIQAPMRSYHSGVSSRDSYVAARSAFKLAGGKRRAKRTVLFQN